MNSVQKAITLGLRLVKIGATNPRRLSHVLGTALSATDDVAEKSSDLLSIPSQYVNDLLPEAGTFLDLRMMVAPAPRASIYIHEFTVLLLLLKRANARKVFEFGTFKGVSVTHFALNLPPESEIYTLDLPENAPATRFVIEDRAQAAIAAEPGKGTLVPAALRPRIKFLQQDSATFDETPFIGKMDFIFVDGAHNYVYVKNDSEKAWRMLRSGGILAWHDCRPQDPDVVRFLLESPYKPARIAGTTVAFATKP